MLLGFEYASASNLVFKYIMGTFIYIYSHRYIQNLVK